MYDTRTPFGHHWPMTDEKVESRLSWLILANQWEADHQRHLLDVREEEGMLLMRNPIPSRKAFGIFGLLLGTLPPAAIFFKFFGGALAHSHDYIPLLMLLLFMNAVCCLAGGYFGSKLSHMITKVEHDFWLLMLIEALIIGFIWGASTGAVGGLIVWGLGAIFGAACAIPVGMAAFGLFVPLHRLLARGGMIDARHFWPLACGVVMVITALILGM